MTVDIMRDRIIVSDTLDFDAAKTLECGQVFRFERIGNNDYYLFALDKKCHVSTKDGSTVIQTDDTDFFYSYFDLDTNYDQIAEQLKAFGELSSAVEAGRGIRILRQDPFETIVSFIISANNNIPRIKGIIQRLCDNFGQKMDGYSAFVTKEDFAKMSKEDFALLRAGFREEYLYSNREALSRDSFYANLRSMDSKSAEKQLISLKGVGPKVAACIMLFSLSCFDSYPVDTWIYKANKSRQLNSVQKVREYYQARYKNLAGYAQQYIFFSKRNLKL